MNKNNSNSANTSASSNDVNAAAVSQQPAEKSNAAGDGYSAVTPQQRESTKENGSTATTTNSPLASTKPTRRSSRRSKPRIMDYPECSL